MGGGEAKGETGEVLGKCLLILGVKGVVARVLSTKSLRGLACRFQAKKMTAALRWPCNKLGAGFTRHVGNN